MFRTLIRDPPSRTMTSGKRSKSGWSCDLALEHCLLERLTEQMAKSRQFDRALLHHISPSSSFTTEIRSEKQALDGTNDHVRSAGGGRRPDEE
jgi:hypothetical protein